MSDHALKRTLQRIRVDEVSTVDRPAIEETFVLIKSVVGKTDLPLASRETAWDGSAAGQRVVDLYTKDGKTDWKAVHNAFFWVDPEKAETITGHKLGFADVKDGSLQAIPNGIIAVAAVLQGARGGVDIPESDQTEIKGKVEAYYSKMDLTPPWKETKAVDGKEEKPVMAEPDTVNEAISKAPNHDALLKEKVAVVAKVAADLAAQAASMDPKALREKVYALSDLVYGIDGVGSVVALAKNMVDKRIGEGDAKGAIFAIRDELRKATGGSPMDEAKLKEWQEKAKSMGKKLKMKSETEPECDAEGNPLMEDDPEAKREPTKKFTAERTQKIASAAEALSTVMKEMGVSDLHALADLVKAEKVEGEDEEECKNVKKALDSIGLKPATITKSAADDEKATTEVLAKIAVLEKKLEDLGNAAAPRALGNDGQRIEKGVAKDFWKGLPL